VWAFRQRLCEVGAVALEFGSCWQHFAAHLPGGDWPHLLRRALHNIHCELGRVQVPVRAKSIFLKTDINELKLVSIRIFLLSLSTTEGAMLLPRVIAGSQASSDRVHERENTREIEHEKACEKKIVTYSEASSFDRTTSKVAWCGTPA
jgi:hypothetical protein